MTRLKQATSEESVHDPRNLWRDLILEVLCLTTAIFIILVVGNRIQSIGDDVDLPWLSMTAVGLYELVWQNLLLLSFALTVSETGMTLHRLKSKATVATTAKVIEKDHTNIWSIAITILTGLFSGWMMIGYLILLPIGPIEL